MGCNCGDNEYNITVNNNGNCEPTTPIYNITLANVGVNGYSPIVRFINETVESFNIAVDNITGTETSPAVPKLSYVADQINNVNTTIANLGNTYLTKDGSNAANPISLNGLTIREQYGNLYISSNTLVSFSSNANPISIGGSSIDLISTNAGRIRLLPSNGVILEGAENKNISLTTSGTGKATYNYQEIATVNQLPTVGNGTITITQGGVTKGTFTTNQSGNSTIQLDGAIIDNPFVVNASTGYEGDAVLYASGVNNNTDSGIKLETIWTGEEGRWTKGLYINNGGRYNDYPSISYKTEVNAGGNSLYAETELGFINTGIYRTTPSLFYPITVTRGEGDAGYIISLKYDDDTLKVNQNGELYADVQSSSYTAGNGIDITNDVISVDENDLSFLKNDGSNADINFTVNGIKLSANTISSSVSTGGTGLLLNQTTSGNYIDIGAGTTGTHFYTNGFFFSSDTSNQIPDITISSTGDIKIYPTLGAKLYYGSSKTAANEVATKGNLPSNFTGCDSITAGTAGLVPAPSAGDEDKFLKADGTWDTVGGGVSEVFIAEYGTATYQEVLDAYNTSKVVFCYDDNNNTYAPITNYTGTEFYFSTGLVNNISASYVLDNNDSWDGGTITLATVAISGSYNDLSGKPTIPTVNNPTITFTQGGTTKGTITLNQSSDATIALDAGGSTITVDQTYDGTSANAQSGVAIQGELTTNYQGKLTAGSNIQINGTTISATNTTYSAMTVSEGTTGTATTARTMRADRLKSIIQGTKLTGLSTADNSAVEATDSILTGIGKLQAEVNNTIPADVLQVALHDKVDYFEVDSPLTDTWQVNSNAELSTSASVSNSGILSDTDYYEYWALQNITTDDFIDNQTSYWKVHFKFRTSSSNEVQPFFAIADGAGEYDTNFIELYVTGGYLKTLNETTSISVPTNTWIEVDIEHIEGASNVSATINVEGTISTVSNVLDNNYTLSLAKGVEWLGLGVTPFEFDITWNGFYVQNAPYGAKYCILTDRHLGADLSSKQDALVSGTNIKTVNNTSLLGSGNIDTSEIFVAEYGTTTTTQITQALGDGKAIFCIKSASSVDHIYYYSGTATIEGLSAFTFSRAYQNTTEVVYVSSSTNQWNTITKTLADDDLSNVSSIDSGSAVQTALNGKVSTSGDTMTGDLSLSYGNPVIMLKNEDITKGTNPSTEKYTTLEFCDGTGSTWQTRRLGFVQHILMTDGTSKLAVGATKNVASSTDNSNIVLQETSAGVATCSFPNTTCVDGQWTNNTASNIVNGSNITWTSGHNYDLSSYLPDDGKKYEVIFTASWNGSTAGSNHELRASTDIITSAWNWLGRVSGQNAAGGTCILPVGSGRYVKLTTAAKACNAVYFSALGYRRLGTNS